MFKDKYRLTQAVLDGCKTMTRRVAYCGDLEKPNVCYGLEGKHKDNCVLCDWNKIIAVSAYKVGEVVAIAQSYEKLYDAASPESIKHYLPALKGWDNKMFVKAELMPHHIRITNIRVERLQDISDEDCLREGIYMDYSDIDWDEGDEPNVCFKVRGLKNVIKSDEFYLPKSAFSALIDKISGKGTWERNPYVFVYEFELVD